MAKEAMEKEAMGLVRAVGGAAAKKFGGNVISNLAKPLQWIGRASEGKGLMGFGERALRYGNKGVAHGKNMVSGADRGLANYAAKNYANSPLAKPMMPQWFNKFTGRSTQNMRTTGSEVSRLAPHNQQPIKLSTPGTAGTPGSPMQYHPNGGIMQATPGTAGTPASNTMFKHIAGDASSAAGAAPTQAYRRLQLASGGLAAVPMAAAFTGATDDIPVLGTALRYGTMPIYSAGSDMFGAYQNAGTTGATQASAAILNQMRNASFMDRMGYLMSPGGATNQMQAAMNQYLPGFSEYYNQAYGGRV